MDKILELFRSSDISNHLLALELIKGLGLDLEEIVTKIFHDKSFWTLQPSYYVTTCGYTNIYYDLYLYDFNFCIRPDGLELCIYNLEGNHHKKAEKDIYREVSSEAEIIRIITKLLLKAT